LKPWQQGYEKGKIYGFQPTYEELKHVMPEDIKGEELRFSAYL